mgnify:CR=1 FL=1
MTKKTQVLDTSVLVSDPLCYKNLPDSDIIIPIVVLEELDKLKKFPGETGRNARVCIRLIDEISEKGNINLGIELENNSTLKVDCEFVDDDKLVGLGDPKYGDTRILACALKHASSLEDKEVVLVSNDFNLKVKARSHGILATSHKAGLRNLSDLFGGISTVIDRDAGLDLMDDTYLDAPSYDLGHLNENEFVLFVDDEGVDVSYGRKVGDKIKRVEKVPAHNLFPRNPEQAFAIDLITDKKIDLITLIGKAGTGKSLVALAAALELVLNKKTHDRLVIYRPIQPVGKDIGYLPGSEKEKLEPWMQPIMDNLEVLFTKNKKSRDNWKRDVENLQRPGHEKIEMEAITFVRGRSIPNSIILIDEAQNLSHDEVKTILTRAGDGTKIIITGDIEQIDNDDLDATNNGLTYVIEKFKTEAMAGHVTLTKGERSALASKAAEIL